MGPSESFALSTLWETIRGNAIIAHYYSVSAWVEDNAITLYLSSCNKVGRGGGLGRGAAFLCAKTRSDEVSSLLLDGSPGISRPFLGFVEVPLRIPRACICAPPPRPHFFHSQRRPLSLSCAKKPSATSAPLNNAMCHLGTRQARLQHASQARVSILLMHYLIWKMEAAIKKCRKLHLTFYAINNVL
jgi:hypothetical protein